MRKGFLYISMCGVMLLTVATANAQQVSQQEAFRKATAFFNKEQPTIKQKALLAYQATKSVASQTTEDDGSR